MLRDFREMLERIAEQSQDRDTKTAFMIDCGGGRVITASNRLPFGVRETESRVSRPGKDDWIGHAERRAIAKAARYGGGLEGSTGYSSWFPCAPCAGSIIDAGISRIVCNRKAYESRVDDPRYGFAAAMEMLNEAGVRVEWY
jgi:dCMP deaminase